jgi:hypothetical protein
MFYVACACLFVASILFFIEPDQKRAYDMIRESPGLLTPE